MAADPPFFTERQRKQLLGALWEADDAALRSPLFWVWLGSRLDGSVVDDLMQLDRVDRARFRTELDLILLDSGCFAEASPGGRIRPSPLVDDTERWRAERLAPKQKSTRKPRS